MKKKFTLLLLCIACGILTLGAQNNNETKTLKRKVAIGKFYNFSRYARGLLYDPAKDPVGNHAMQLLSIKLTQSEKFLLLERKDIDIITKELEESGQVSNKIGADYIIIGSIIEMERKSEGKQGLFSSSKKQSVEARVNLKLIDVSTGLVIFADEGSGNSAQFSKTVMGLGGKGDFDGTLEDKAISNAMDGLVTNVIQKCLDNPWKAYILGESKNGEYIISGGKSQGIKIGDIYKVMTKGEKIKNPQTGIIIELPGEEVAKIKITKLMKGATPETEVSMAIITSGTIDPSQTSNYFITD